VDRKQERAFEDFVASHGDALLRLATLLTSDQGLGEDAYQETLHRLAARWSRVDSPHAYCRKILHNIVIDQARKQQRQPAEVQLHEAHDDGDARALDTAAAVEIRPVLLAALAALTPHQRAIVVLRYFDDRSELEVADLLGVSPGTVKSTASRAMAQLRQQPALLAVTHAHTETDRKVRYA
jgi:RNA polymerase sigma-70 factor (sigma-E family)